VARHLLHDPTIGEVAQPNAPELGGDLEAKQSQRFGLIENGVANGVVPINLGRIDSLDQKAADTV
jgi:hypothetical protein